jgi:hypothetical protein
LNCSDSYIIVISPKHHVATLSFFRSYAFIWTQRWVGLIKISVSKRYVIQFYYLGHYLFSDV